MSSSIYTDGTYLQQHPTWDTEHSPFKAKHIINLLRKNQVECRSIADIGCGAGGVLAAMENSLQGISMHGFDVSPQAIALGKKLYPGKLELFCEDPFKSKARYDVAMAIDIIEHVENPLEFLRNLKQIARYKVLHIPLEINMRWMASPQMYLGANRANGHLHFFNKEIALAHLSWSNLEVIDMVYTPHSIELAYGWKSRLAAFPRRILSAINEDIAVRYLGGWSLLVLAK